MIPRSLVAVSLLGLAIPVLPQAVSDEVLLLARLRDHIGAQIMQLADYTCLQTSRRYRLQGSNEKKRRIESAEMLTLEVAHVGEKELFAWPGAGRFEDREASDIVAGGLTDTGTFSLFARSLFQPRTPAAVRYHGPEECQGRDAVRYDFTVSPLFSGYTIKSSSGSAQVGYSGSFWAYPDTLDLCRLVVRAEDIPESLALAGVRTLIDYGQVRIGGLPVKLPQSARTTMTFVSGDISENVTDFTHCRRYTADSSILFDTGSEQASSASHQLETVTLPPRLMVVVHLTAPIDSKSARVGDAISARVAADVSARHQTWLPAGAILNGRIRRLEQFTSPSESLLLGLEFTNFSYAGRTGLFLADFQRSKAGVQAEGVLKAPSVTTNYTALLHGGILAATEVEEFTSQELAGVVTFHFSGKTGRLPAGTEMVWKTKELQVGR
jgi:hypothetical protein